MGGGATIRCAAAQRIVAPIVQRALNNPQAKKKIMPKIYPKISLSIPAIATAYASSIPNRPACPPIPPFPIEYEYQPTSDAPGFGMRIRSRL